MHALTKILIVVGIFIAGILVRMAVVVLIGTLVAVPLVVIMIGVRKFGALWQRAGVVVAVGGLPWKAGLYYAPGHTWVRRGWRAARVGLDGVANRIVVDTRALELPKPGTKVRAGEVVCRVICGDKHAGIASPVDGVVSATNEALDRNPSALHRDPYGEGWLFDVIPANFRYGCLWRGRSARRWFSAEAARLREFLERDLGLATADGGELVLATPALLNNEQWMVLAESFLYAKTAASPDRVEAPGTGWRTLLLGVSGPVVGGLYVIFLPIIGFLMLLGVGLQRLWRLLRSGATCATARLSRPPRL
jgi:glycine cleavage system H protein